MQIKDNQENPFHDQKQLSDVHRQPDGSIVCQLSDSGKWLELAEESGFRASNITKKLHVSSRQFRRVVRAIFGSAPEDVLTDWRLVLSKKVLQRLRRVKGTAVVLGYKQPSHFSRQFKARYGISPKAFLASLGQG